MTRGAQGPSGPGYSTFDRWFGERNMGIGDWPAVPIYQQSRSVFQVLVQCDPDSANAVRVGSPTNQWIHLRPGESLTIPIGDVSQVYVEGINGAATINWCAME